MFLPVQVSNEATRTIARACVMSVTSLSVLSCPGPSDDEDREEPSRLGEPVRVASRDLPADAPIQQAHETTVEQTVDGKTWTLLVRTYRLANNKLFIVRGFAEKTRIARVKDELEKALDSFQIAKGP